MLYSNYEEILVWQKKIGLGLGTTTNIAGMDNIHNIYSRYNNFGKNLFQPNILSIPSLNCDNYFYRDRLDYLRRASVGNMVGQIKKIGKFGVEIML